MLKPLWRPYRIALEVVSRYENHSGAPTESLSRCSRNAKTTLATLQNRFRGGLKVISGLGFKIKKISQHFFIQFSSYNSSLKVIIFGNLRGGALPRPKKVASRCVKHLGAPTESLSRWSRDAKTTLAPLQDRFRSVFEMRKTLWRPCRIAFEVSSRCENHSGARTE